MKNEEETKMNNNNNIFGENYQSNFSINSRFASNISNKK